MINIVSLTGIVRHIGIADNFRRLLKSIDNKMTLSLQSRRCPFKVDVVRTKCEHYSYKVVVVLVKLTLFVQSVNIIRAKSSLSLQSWRCYNKVWPLFVQSCRCPCKVDVVRTKCEHYSYKVVVVLAKLTLFGQSWRRSLHKVLYKERRKLAS